MGQVADLKQPVAKQREEIARLKWVSPRPRQVDATGQGGGAGPPDRRTGGIAPQGPRVPCALVGRANGCYQRSCEQGLCMLEKLGDTFVGYAFDLLQHGDPPE